MNWRNTRSCSGFEGTFLYKQQARYEAQLKKLGILSDKDYTCTCYLDRCV